MAGDVDPLEAFFGRAARTLFEGQTFVVEHGPVERWPSWTRSGPLASIAALSQAYKGRLEVAQGRTSEPVAGQEFIGRGGQVRVQGTRADALLQLGLTVFFVDIEGTVPESAAFLRELETALGVNRCAAAGVFANAPGSGLPWHHDSHDQLLIQLSGRKVFAHVDERSADHPGIPFSPTSIVHPDFPAVYGNGFVDSAAEIEARGVMTTVLEPGSCLFLPAGTFHRTVDQPEAALSLAIAVRPPSRLDLLVAALRFGALSSPHWRAPAYGFFPVSAEGQEPAAARAATSAEVARLAARLKDLSEVEQASAWLARERERVDVAVEMRRPRFSRYVRVPSTAVAWEAASEERIVCIVRPVDATLPSRLGLAAQARPIVEHVLSTVRAFNVEDLVRAFQEFEETEIADLLDQLSGVGLLAPIPFDTWGDL